MSHKEFSSHWESIHGPLIRGLKDIDQYLIRYMQHHLTPETQYPGPEGLDYDGFSEGWFVDEKARQKLFALPDFQDAVRDEETFLDMTATRWIIRDAQKVMIPGPE